MTVIYDNKTKPSQKVITFCDGFSYYCHKVQFVTVVIWRLAWRCFFVIRHFLWPILYLPWQCAYVIQTNFFCSGSGCVDAALGLVGRVLPRRGRAEPTYRTPSLSLSNSLGRDHLKLIHCVVGSATQLPSYPSPPRLEWRPVELQFWSFPAVVPIRPRPAMGVGSSPIVPPEPIHLHH